MCEQLQATCTHGWVGRWCWRDAAGVMLLAVGLLQLGAAAAIQMGPCPWGGITYPEHAWAKPRTENDGGMARGWYCSKAAAFKNDKFTAVAIGTELLVLGDSNMHCLREDWGPCPGVPQFFKDTWGTWYNARSWGLKDDTTSTLFWRVANGNGPSSMGLKVVLLLVGVHDLLKAKPADLAATGLQVGDRVRQTVEVMLQHDRDVMVGVIGVLPFSRNGQDGHPTHVYSQADRQAVDAALTQIKHLELHNKSRVRYISCEHAFLAGNVSQGQAIRREVYTDGVHLNLEGHKLLQECVEPHLGGLMANYKRTEFSPVPKPETTS